MKNYYFQNGKFISKENIDTICQQLKTLFEDQADINKSLRDELQSIKDEKWRDSQLIQMKDRLKTAKDNLYRGFGISEDEEKAIKDWRTNHLKEKHPYAPSSIGGEFTYEFTPTSIGVIGTCFCGICRNSAFIDSHGDMGLYGKLLKEYDAEFIFEELS